MKRRYLLFRRKRGGVFYLEDTETRKQESLGTKNRTEALTLLAVRNESARQPQLNLQIARTYLSASDPEAIAPTSSTGRATASRPKPSTVTKASAALTSSARFSSRSWPSLSVR